MRKHIAMISLAALVVGLLAMYTFAFQVDEQKDIVLIETFGEVTWTIVGRHDPGLKVKWPYPIQKVVRYDGRVSVFEDTGDQASTADKQNLLVTVYCAWQIDEKNPARFHQSVKADDPEGKMARVQEGIRGLVRDAKKKTMGKHNMVDFINTDPRLMKLDTIEDEILSRVHDQAKNDYGVKIVRVGIKSLGLPETVTAKVIDAMKAERQRDVNMYTQEGESLATAIKERAKSDSAQILAFAERKANAIRSQGAQAAARYYVRFKDARFSTFLRELESLKVELARKTVFLLDGSALSHMRWFRDGPDLGPVKPGSGTTEGTE